MKDWRRTGKYDWIKSSFNSSDYDNICIKKKLHLKRFKISNFSRNDLFYFKTERTEKDNYIVVYGKDKEKEFKDLRKAKKFVKDYMRKH